MSMLEVSGLKKIYKTRFDGNQVEALRSVSFQVEQGSMWPSWGNPAPERPPF